MDFNSILIGSDDPETLVEYYTKLLGEPVFSGGGYTSWQIGSGNMTVGLHSEVKGKNTSPGRIIWNIETADVAGRVRADEGRRCDRRHGAVQRSRRRPARRSRRSPTPTATTSSS